MSNKEYIEPEEKDLDKNNSDDAIIMDDFNPLDEAVSEKEYTKHNVTVNPKDFTSDIPEPSFMPPPMMGAMNDEEKSKKPQEPFNPKMNDMPKKDKHDAAGKVAEMIMSGYKFGNQMADNSLLFNERKIAKMQQNGEIDLSVEVPISPTSSMSAGEFIQEFNDQSKGTIAVTKEFEEEVTPVLTRVLEKRGIGMTDEQLLIYLFSKDILVKGFMVVQSLNVKKDMLNMLKEATTGRVGGVAPTPQPQPTPQPTYEPTPTPQYEPQQEQVYSQPHNPATNVNDFVNEMTGGIPQYQEEFVDEVQEEFKEVKPKVKIISEGTKKPLGKRGRPSKKK